MLIVKMIYALICAAMLYGGTLPGYRALLFFGGVFTLAGLVLYRLDLVVRECPNASKEETISASSPRSLTQRATTG